MIPPSKKLLAALINIRDQGPTYRHNGICLNAYHLTSSTDANKLLRGLLVEWPGNLGQIYPVEGSDVLYKKASLMGTLWQNERRHELLNWLIAKLQEDNHDEPSQTAATDSPDNRP